MINETIILAVPLRDRPEHPLAKHIRSLFVVNMRWDLCLYQPLQEIFSKVIFFDYPERIGELGIKGSNEEIIELVKREHPKYLLWVGAKYEFQESTLNAIRREGTTVIGWFLDDEFRFDNYSKWWIPYLDYCITLDIEAVPKYKELGARVIRTVPCCGVEVDVDWANIKEKYEVSFVGALQRPGREQYINELRERGISVQLFGKGLGGFIAFEEMLEIFKSSKINLNFSRAPHSNRMGFKGRIIEVCLAGGFLLTEYVPYIENYFEIDKEIVCFHNTDEMVKKITYYLNHDEERRAIAKAGWERATSEYTPVQILSRIFGEIEKDTIRGERSFQEPKMPMWIRKKFSTSYTGWQKAFALEDSKDLSRETFKLSISYYPFNLWAWVYYLASFLPRPAYLGAYKLGRWVYHIWGKPKTRAPGKG